MIFKIEILFVLVVVFMLSLGGDLFATTKMKNHPKIEVGLSEREYLVNALIKIAEPVLEALSKNQLKELMPIESAPYQEADRKNYTYLEVLGRTLAGMAPWPELGPDDSPEGQLSEKYILLALQSIRIATDPESGDFMNFTKGGQPLVDAAFLSYAFLRAPNQLWGRLSSTDKEHVIIGVAGHQPKAGEGYIYTGSLYLCTEGLLMLGLPASDTFWQGEDEKWTSKNHGEVNIFR